jgi:hypothetical protein
VLFVFFGFGCAILMKEGGIALADDRTPPVCGSLVLSAQEKKIITILRELKYGEVKVIVQDGIPIRVDEIRKSIKI